MSFTDLLPFDTVVISRQTLARDSSGGATHTPYVQRIEVAARVESLTISQQLRFQQLSQSVTHRVFIDDPSQVKNGDVITTSDGLTIRVTAINQNKGLGDIDTYGEILGEEVKIAG